MTADGWMGRIDLTVGSDAGILTENSQGLFKIEEREEQENGGWSLTLQLDGRSALTVS